MCAAGPSLHSLFHFVAHQETTPYTYFLFLHEWLVFTGSQAEWVTRLPSAVAGVVLIGAVYWMARAFVDRRVALGAAALCALSPLIQSYAQEARVYIFAMLVLVIAVGAAVRAAQQAEHRVALLSLSALSCFLALWLHYTAIAAVVPLAVFVASRSELAWRARAGFVAACVVGQATLMPLLLQQYGYSPNGGAILGQINWGNTVSVIGTPFGIRVGTPLNVWSVAGAAIMLGAVLTLLFAPGRERIAHRGLLVTLGAVGVIGLFGLDLTGKHILITRYTAVTAPFLVTALAAACAALPRAGAVVSALATLTVSVAGLVVNHTAAGFYAPARQVVAYLAPREQADDFMLTPGIPLTDVPIFYYDTRRLRPKLHFFGLPDPRARSVLRKARRLWLVDRPRSANAGAAVAIVNRRLRAHRFHVVSVQLYTTSTTLAVIRAVR